MCYVQQGPENNTLLSGRNILSDCTFHKKVDYLHNCKIYIFQQNIIAVLNLFLYYFDMFA